MSITGRDLREKLRKGELPDPRIMRESTSAILAGIASSSWTAAEISAGGSVPRSPPMCRPSRYSAVICATKAFVEATATSGPACV